jgi:hypothetical protein
MASTLSGNINSSVSMTLAAAIAGLSGQSTQLPLSLPTLLALTFTSGTGANKANQMWVSNRTLANSATEDLDMYNPASADAVGNAFTIATIKALIIQNLSATESDTLTIGGKGTTAAWTSFFGSNTYTAKITGGGTLILTQPGATGFVVGASSTNHLLTVAATAAVSINYTVIIIGATA